MPAIRVYDILFEPVRIGPKTLRNRFYQVPHCTGFGVEKPWSQARPPRGQGGGRLGGRLHRVRRINAESDETPYISASMWDDDDVRMLAGVRRGARHGALAGIELSHTGVHGENGETRLPRPRRRRSPATSQRASCRRR